jgi:hypothetical protein
MLPGSRKHGMYPHPLFAPGIFPPNDQPRLYSWTLTLFTGPGKNEIL